jgi:Uncharacterized conserved protein
MENSKQKFKTIGAYHASFPKNVSAILEVLRKTIQRAAPEAEELISYNMPSFKWNGFLISYGAWKEHIGLYPAPKATGKLKKQLTAYHDGKSTLKFPLDEPIPGELITEIVALRMKENLRKLKAKKKELRT